MIRSGAKYKEVLREYLKIYKRPEKYLSFSLKLLSERTYYRIKHDAESILNRDSHRLKASSYRKNHDDERKTWESHCKQKVLDLHRRKYAVKLNVQTVQLVLRNEAQKFDFDWLKKLQFTHRYAERFMAENDLVFTNKNSQQNYVSAEQMSIFRSTVASALTHYDADLCLNIDESPVFIFRNRNGQTNNCSLLKMFALKNVR